jgi:hypothetical protein
MIMAGAQPPGCVFVPDGTDVDPSRGGDRGTLVDLELENRFAFAASLILEWVPMYAPIQFREIRVIGYLHMSSTCPNTRALTEV